MSDASAVCAPPEAACGAPGELEFKLLNRFQRGFPLCPRPFAALAAQLDTDEASVLGALRALQANGAVSRVGAVFRPNIIGASALAALAVPPERLEQVAAYVSSRPEINHNYEREHRFNLWFVATAASAARLQAVLGEIEAGAACGPVLILPLVEDYHIDLGFDLGVARAGAHGPVPVRAPAPPPLAPDAAEWALIGAIEDGLALVARPFAGLGPGMDEEAAIATLERWQASGVVRRFGVVVRHRELGYKANAMVVWDIPEGLVGEVGRRIAAAGLVSLCYQRPRRLPHWRYNLFCMLHGKDRGEVEARISALIAACALDGYAHATLFSRRRFKQRGARYAPSTGKTYGSA